MEEDLFLIVYDELRSLARSRLAKLPPGNTLQPTALVHDVFLKLERSGSDAWNSKGHFFGAAAEAMRQILVDQARAKSALKRGGGWERSEAQADDLQGLLNVEPEMLLTIHEALKELEARDESLAEIVKLRYFSGLPMTEIASLLDVPLRTLHRRWRFAAAQLRGSLIDTGWGEAVVDGHEA